MEIKSRIIGALINIYQTAKNSRFDEMEFLLIENDLKIVQDYFSINKINSIITSIIFSSTARGRSIEPAEIINYVGAESLEVFNYSDNLAELRKRNIVTRNRTSQRSKTVLSESYAIHSEIIKAISDNMPMPTLSEKHCNSPLELLELIFETSIDDGWNETDRLDVPLEVKNILESNTGLDLVKRFRSYQLPLAETYVYSIVIWRFLNGEACKLSEVAENFYKRKVDRMMFIQQMLNNNSKLTQLDLCKIETTEEFFHSIDVKLTAKSISLLAQDGIKLNVKSKIETKNVINPQKIIKKALFYNDYEKKQIELISNLLLEKEFKKTQRRLKEYNLPEAVSIVFFGPPGCGKTEEVLQLSRITKRPLFKVELSECKSKWYGESQRIVKNIFNDFYAFKNSCKISPILFFNEMDGLFQSRTKATTSTEQTDYAIQSVLLNELENFKDIIICTTNLISNIDSAFARRFLFKVKIDAPGFNVREQIWKSKIKNLTQEEYNQISKHNLSGSGIENVIRKYSIHSLLYKEEGVQLLTEFCKQEEITFGARTKTNIGYKL